MLVVITGSGVGVIPGFATIWLVIVGVIDAEVAVGVRLLIIGD
jgi:hypothetical protein